MFCKQDNFIKEKKYKDVYWTLPHQKRHFGTTTIGSDNLIRALSEDNKTVMDIYNLITSDPDAKEILKKFIDAGYENFIMKDFVTDKKNVTLYQINDSTIMSDASVTYTNNGTSVVLLENTIFKLNKTITPDQNSQIERINYFSII